VLRPPPGYLLIHPKKNWEMSENLTTFKTQLSQYGGFPILILFPVGLRGIHKFKSVFESKQVFELTSFA
jgi:hypothetical protein